jgi:hypothetical protein
MAGPGGRNIEPSEWCHNWTGKGLRGRATPRESVPSISALFDWFVNLSFHYHLESFHYHLKSFHNRLENFHSGVRNTVKSHPG